jgi:predicted  nucleic acid-binding Zn-ribbon protein
MSDENTSSQPPSVGERMGSAFKTFIIALFRLIVLAIMLGVIGVVVFWGIPLLYRQYVLPFQNRMLALEEAQVSQGQDLLDITESLEEIQSRMNDMEVQNDTTKQQLDELSSQIAQLQDAQQSYLDSVVSTQEANQETFEEIASSLEQFDSRIKRLAGAVEKTNQQIADLEKQLDSLNERMESEETPLAALRRDLQVVKAMELLTRGRLFIVENNLGLASEDIRAARDLLAVLPTNAFPEETHSLIIVHLDLALENLPESPVVAAENLEIAWQLLRQGLPEEPALDEKLSDTPTPTSDQTLLSPSPTPTATPTPTSAN